MKFLRQLLESIRFAWQALLSNILRTTLSLLGVTIGIFSIVAVLTFVYSMQIGINEQIDSFGKGVVYVGKWPWVFSNNFPWWKYMNRPSTKYSDYKYLLDNVQNSEATAIIDNTSTTLKNGNNSMQVSLNGVSFDYNQISEVPVEDGRYFLTNETDNSAFVVILGANVKEALFPNIGDAVDQSIKVNGIKFRVIGVMRKKGEDLISLGGSPDDRAFIPYTSYASLFQKDNPEPIIALKGMPSDVGQQVLEGEVTGLMRSRRGIKPTQDNNFSINRMDGAVKFFDTIFSSLNVGGFVIALFSLLVGGFGIANIMFVSVKERTNIIGIQKSLGAKNYFILFQFLFEAIFLSLIGGVVGVVLVWLMSFIDFGSLKLVVTKSNVILGLSISSVIGIISGIVPAWIASKLDPVVAIRSK